MTRLHRGIDGDDWLDRHGDRFLAIHAPDLIVEGRTRAGLRYRTEGRDEGVAEARSLYDVGLRRLTVTPLEVRGELALIRFTNDAEQTDLGGGAAVVEQLAVCRANADDLVDLVVIFEDSDPDLALELLDHLHGG